MYFAPDLLTALSLTLLSLFLAQPSRGVSATTGSKIRTWTKNSKP